MTTTDTRSILIIHGAIVRSSTHRWLKEMQTHFVSRGVSDVRVFHWSGHVTVRAIEKASDELSQLLDDCNQSVRVLAKSTGALVFRSAVRKLCTKSAARQFDLLLQVAAPNSTAPEPSLCNVRRIVNIYSRDD